MRSSASARCSGVSGAPAQQLGEFVEQLARKSGEVVDEIQRVLDLVRDAGGELAERGELFRLDQPVLRLAQVVERGREFARARLDLVEHARVLDRDRRLVGEALQQRLFLQGKWPGRRARDENRADAAISPTASAHT